MPTSDTCNHRRQEVTLGGLRGPTAGLARNAVFAGRGAAPTAPATPTGAPPSPGLETAPPAFSNVPLTSTGGLVFTVTFADTCLAYPKPLRSSAPLPFRSHLPPQSALRTRLPFFRLPVGRSRGLLTEGRSRSRSTLTTSVLLGSARLFVSLLCVSPSLTAPRRGPGLLAGPLPTCFPAVLLVLLATTALA